MHQQLHAETAVTQTGADGPVPRTWSSIDPRAATVLALQGTAGNSAVQRLLSGATPPRPTAQGSAFRRDATAARSATGTPLAGEVRGRMETALGGDFGHVRIHTGSEAASRATELDANAFTVGRDVSFADGAYQPGTPVGDAVIAHELAHVVQQDDGGAADSPARMAAEDSAADERTEETLADQAAGQALGALHGGDAAGNGGEAPRTGVLSRLREGLRLRRCTPNLGKAMSSATARSVQWNASHPLTPSHGDNKVNPTWTPGAVDHAVAYTKSSAPSVDATFDIGDFKAPPAGTTVSVRVKEGGAVRGSVAGIAPAASIRVPGLVLTGLTGSPQVRSTTYNLDWEASIDGTTWTPVTSTGVHPVYWLLDTPKTVPTPSLAVSKAAGYANGAASAADVAARLQSGPRSVDGMAYDPADPIDADPLDVYTNGVGICTDYGNLVALLARSVGIPGNSVMYYGGFDYHGLMAWITMGGSMLTLKNVRPGRPAFGPVGKPAWDFNYHVIARVGGALYDAALDRAGYDAQAMHEGLAVRLLDLAAGALPAATRGTSYTAQVPRVDNTVAVTLRDFGQVTSADFGLVMPVHVPPAAVSPVEVPGATWTVTAGALPPGLTLNPATGVVAGTPGAKAARKTYTFTVQTSKAGVISSADYTVVLS